LWQKICLKEEIFWRFRPAASGSRFRFGIVSLLIASGSRLGDGRERSSGKDSPSLVESILRCAMRKSTIRRERDNLSRADQKRSEEMIECGTTTLR
jgi:hypothetical protein